MSEAFVETLERDYTRVKILPHPDTYHALSPLWIKDDCEIYLQSGLKSRSPRSS